MKYSQYPKPNINGNSQFDFNKPYPFKISPEVYPDYPFPKSLCFFADKCPVDDSFENFCEDTVSDCKHCNDNGCPIYLLSFSEFETFEEVKNVELFALNQEHSKGFTIEMLKDMVKNFKLLKTYHEVPMAVLGHGETQELLSESGLPAAGWLSALKLFGEKLIGDFKDVPKLIAPLLKNGAYKKRSVEVYKQFKYGEKTLGPVIRRIAFLGFDIPKIKGLSDIVARYSEAGSIRSTEDLDLKTFFMEDVMKDTNKFYQSFVYKTEGNLKLGESLKLGELSGKITKLSEQELEIELLGENFFNSGDAPANEAGDVVNFAEMAVPKPYASNFASISEKIYEELGVDATVGKNLIISAILASVKKRDLTDDQKKILQIGWPKIHGEFKAKFSAIKASDAYPDPPTKKPEEVKKMSELSAEDKLKIEKFSEFQEENLKLKAELEKQNATISTQADRIKNIEELQYRNQALLHLKDVQLFSENLKTKGIAPAVFDDSSFRPFILSLDWHKPLKFSEGKEELTFYDQFKVLFSEMMGLATENKLVVPLTPIPKASEEDTSLVEGFDPQGVLLDSEIRKFSEDNKVSYDKAYETVIKLHAIKPSN